MLFLAYIMIDCGITSVLSRQEVGRFCLSSHVLDLLEAISVSAVRTHLTIISAAVYSARILYRMIISEYVSSIG
jgi:hypothetical protein